jgi:uncharacterized protein (UPF0332 family)
MSYQEFVKKGLLRKEKIDFKQINQVMIKARRDLKSAKILLEKGYEDASYRLAYEAMLLAGRALVFSFGFRPRALGSHKIVVEFVKKVLGKNFEVLTKKFDKMRKKRNYLIYGTGLAISKTEAENSIKTAEEFIGI